MDFDGAYKTLFSNPEMIENLLRHFVQEDWVNHSDFSTLERVNASFVGDHLVRRQGPEATSIGGLLFQLELDARILG